MGTFLNFGSLISKTKGETVMKGKEKCRILKEIRAKIAEENNIEYVVSECTHKGDCKGTCPKCESEVRYLEKQLERRKNLGKSVAVAGLVAGIGFSAMSCEYLEEKGGSDIQGDLRAVEETLDGNIETEVTEGIFPEEEEQEDGELMGEPIEEVEIMGDIALSEDFEGLLTVD